jgi:hypothetical protein
MFIWPLKLLYFFFFWFLDNVAFQGGFGLGAGKRKTTGNSVVFLFPGPKPNP